MKSTYILLVALFLSSYIVHSQEMFVIEGAIVLKDSQDSTPEPGKIRFNETTNDFEGWNGLYWASLTGHQYDIGQMTDQDGNIYPTVKIGGWEWMAKNLKATHYANGDFIVPIANHALGESMWNNATYGAYAVYDTTSGEHPFFNIDEFGLLYNGYAVADNRGICPNGWHVPSGDEASLPEWLVMIHRLGGPELAGRELKDATHTYWPNGEDATNSSGFTALPGGMRHRSGEFYSLGETAFWWSSTESGGLRQNLELSNSSTRVEESEKDKRTGLSVRCLKD